VRTALAVVVAVGLVAGALYLRTTVIAPDAGGAADVATDADGPPAADVPEDLVVACDADLGDACPAGAQVLDGSALAAAFVDRADPPDVLVAPTAAVEQLEQVGPGAPTFSAERPVVATSPFVLVTATSAGEQVADACPEVTWACAADLVSSGSFDLGTPSPGTTAGVAALAPLTGGFLGEADFAANAFQSPEFLDWVGVVGDRVRRGGDPLRELLQFGGAQTRGAVVLEAQAQRVLATAARGADVAWPSPLATLDVTAVALDGVDPGVAEEVGAAVGRALRAAGWRGPDGAPPAGALDGAPALDPADDGLPSGGVLLSLARQL
jgi:hypothetical protein